MECEENIPLDVSYWITFSFGALGFIGTVSIIVVFVRFKELRTYSNKLIFNLALSQSISCALNFIPLSLTSNTFVCVAIGISFNSLQLVTIIWAFSLVCTLYLLIGKPAGVYKKKYKYWVWVSWVLVPSLYVLPLITNSYSFPSSSFNNICTFKTDLVSEVWRFGLFFIPAWIFIIVACVLYYKIHKKLKELNLEGESKGFLNRLFYYPAILIAVLLPLSCLRVFNLFKKNCISHLMLEILGWIFAIQGLFDAFVFFGTPSVRSSLRSYNKFRGRISDAYYMSDFTTSSLVSADR